MQILHLDSSLQGEASASRQLSRAIVDALLRASPAAQVRHRDLAADAVPHLTGDIAAGFRGAAGPAPTSVATERARSEQLVAEFLAWIDRIAQPGRTFRDTADGPVGLAGGRRVIVASTRGGLYSLGAGAGMDFQESYLRAFFGFLGIAEVQVVRAERLTQGAGARDASMADALAQVSRAVTDTLATPLITPISA